MNEGELFCEKCGSKVPLETQREKINLAHGATITCFAERCRSSLFLLACSCFTVATLFLIASAVSLGWVGIGVNSLGLAFMIAAALGKWRCYTANDSDKLARRLKSASVYDAFLRTVYILNAIFAAVCFIALFIICLSSGKLLSSFISFVDKDKIGTLLGTAVLVIGIVCVTVILVFGFFYRKRRKYFLALCSTAESGEYKPRKAPVVSSCVLGALSIIVTPGCYVVTSVFTKLGSYLTGFGDIGVKLGSIFVGMNTGLLLFGASSFVLGLYYIASAVWMASVHKAQTAANKALDTEISIYNLLERDTEDAVKSYEQMQQMMQIVRQAVSENMAAAEAAKSEKSLTSDECDSNEEHADEADSASEINSAEQLTEEVAQMSAESVEEDSEDFEKAEEDLQEETAHTS